MIDVYFVTVEWCRKGGRGIFCDTGGTAFRKDGEPHTWEEMRDILGPFVMILSPESRVFTEEQVAKFTWFRPLAEYKREYGIALTEENVPMRVLTRGGGH